jgi:hypothetical protein
MKLAQILAFAILAGELCACQKHKETIFLDSAWNRDYARNLCELNKKNLDVTCVKTPEQMAAEVQLRFASAVLQSAACKDVIVTNERIGERNLKTFENGWSLSFNVGIDGGNIDYSRTEWQIIDIKTNKRFGEGSMKDALEAASRVCIVATGGGGSVLR